jgi:hypothetical protein
MTTLEFLKTVVIRDGISESLGLFSGDLDFMNGFRFQWLFRTHVVCITAILMPRFKKKIRWDEICKFVASGRDAANVTQFIV